MTRRDILLSSAAPLAAPAAAADPRVTLGMATTEFRDYTNSRLARELSAEGVRTIQLFLTQSDSNYWKYNGRSALSGLSSSRVADIAGTYRAAGIRIHSVGVYTNLVHPDAAERKANLEYFEAMMKVGEQMGVHTFITEAGHYEPEGPAARVPYYLGEAAWASTVAAMKELARMAEAHGATVLLEPFFAGLLASAKRARVFLEEVGSPRVRALLDPANLIEVDDLDQMFDQLQPWIGCLHAKDRKLHVFRGVAPGQGDLDYRKFVTLAARRTPEAPLILEYVGSKTYKQALTHVRGVIREAGLTEA